MTSPPTKRWRPWSDRSFVALVGAIAVLLSSLTAASAFGDEGGDSPERELQSVEEIRRADASSYAADHKVDVEEALRRLDAQAGLGDLADQIRQHHDDVLAGIWIEHEPAHKLVVWTTADRPAIRALVAAVEGIEVELRSGARTTYADAIDAMTREAVRFSDVPGLDGYLIDERTGELVLHVGGVGEGVATPLADQAAAEFSERTGIPARVESASTSADDGHTYGGNNLSSCTSGFVVKNSIGTRGYATAGHCNDTQTFFEFGGGSYSTTATSEVRNASTDIQWATTTHSEYPEFYANSTTARRTLKAQKFRSSTIVGDYVCHRGKSTGYSCGDIDNISYVPNDPDACPGTCSPVWILVKGPNLECYPGDSGGPFFNWQTAYGFYKGQSSSGTSASDCTHAYFMSSTYLSNLGVSYVFG